MSFEDGWFLEKNQQWAGVACALQVEEVLFDKKSEYQHVVVFRSKAFGNVLLLDGVIQYTEKDECAYQEMITHLAMFSHPNPENVLVVGGGDGGVIREVIKHKSVKRVVICEIDQVVIDCGKKYFPNIAETWADPRVELMCGDAAVYIKKATNEFDIVVSDTSDPIGPAQPLFEAPFYRDLFKACRVGARVATQAESMWMHLPTVTKLVENGRSIFSNAQYASVTISTYPCGQIGVLVCSKDDEAMGARNKKGAKRPDVSVPVRQVPKGFAHLRYYNSKLHSAAFCLPQFVQDAIDGKNGSSFAPGTTPGTLGADAAPKSSGKKAPTSSQKRKGSEKKGAGKSSAKRARGKK